MKYINIQNKAAAAAIEKEGWILSAPKKLQSEFSSIIIREVYYCDLSDRKFSRWLREKGLLYKDHEEPWTCPSGQVDLQKVYEVLKSLNVESEAIRQSIIDSLR